MLQSIYGLNQEQRYDYTVLCASQCHLLTICGSAVSVKTLALQLPKENLAALITIIMVIIIITISRSALKMD